MGDSVSQWYVRIGQLERPSGVWEEILSEDTSERRGLLVYFYSYLLKQSIYLTGGPAHLQHFYFKRWLQGFLLCPSLDREHNKSSSLIFDQDKLE